MQPPDDTPQGQPPPESHFQYVPPPPAPTPGQPWPNQGTGQPGQPPRGYAPSGYPPPPGQYPYPAPPPPGRKMPWWAFVLAGCGCMVLFVPMLAAILFPVFSQAREAARSTSCLSNQKQMALGILMYTQDYDERMPGSGHWMDDIQPYLRAPSGQADPRELPQFHCPTASMRDNSVYGYAYSSKLNRIETSSLKSPRDTMMTFDSMTLTRNASDSGSSLPSPPRHRRRNNMSFADGHAKAVGGAQSGLSGE